MRVPSLLLTALAVTLSTVPMHAQGSPFDQIMAADGLRYQGEPKAAVAILEPMVQTRASSMTETDLGLAWNVLGSSYEDLHMPDKAKSCYDTAIEKLRPIPTAQAKYAAMILTRSAGSSGLRDVIADTASCSDVAPSNSHQNMAERRSSERGEGRDNVASWRSKLIGSPPEFPRAQPNGMGRSRPKAAFNGCSG